MPTISIKTRAVVDYAAGVLLLASPLALLRCVPFPIHKAIDLRGGGGLAFAPIHFAVHGLPAVLFVVLGLSLIVMAFLTRGRLIPTGQDNPLVPGA